MKNLGLWSCAAFVAVFCVAMAIASPAQTFNVLVNFEGTDGEYPTSPPVQGLDGNFYGTTTLGGSASGDGTLFKVTPAGKLTTLYNFCSADCADGAEPAELVLSTDGNFYGTTSIGGANSSGTVFKITPQGALTTLHTFCSQTGCADGANPYAALVQGPDGNFYGTTSFGGPNFGGTVFKITPQGALTTLHTFCPTPLCADGAFPYAGLVIGTDGNFYGTTSRGANDACEFDGYEGCGTVFRITPAGTLTTLHRFDRTDGAKPFTAMVQAADGDFYGTTAYGGRYNICEHGCGTIFKITAAGALTTLHNFTRYKADGGHPFGGLVQATDGNFYGTAAQGGGDEHGNVYKFVFRSGRGTLTTLHEFDGTDGASPKGGLLQATNGSFYGASAYGGPGGADCSIYGCGTAFNLSVGLEPFVDTLPVSGKVGRSVTILGNDLMGASGVTFNGTAAVFKVITNTEIKATVPVGATTGFVTVTTPSKTLKSNVDFRVTK
jgi:uncharacterized repeat protein (TIGR03803 family)